MKTTFDLNFDLYKAFKLYGYTLHINMETKRSCQLTASLCLLKTYSLLKKKVVFNVLIKTPPTEK